MAKAVSSMKVEHVLGAQEVHATELYMTDKAEEGTVMTCIDPATGHGVWKRTVLNDSAPQFQNTANPSKQVCLECSTVSPGTTSVVHMPKVEGWVPNQETSTTAVPTFAGLRIPTGAVVGYVLTCDNAVTGNFVPLPAAGGSGMSVPFDDTTPLLKCSYDASKRARFDVSKVMPGYTRTIYVPNADVLLADQDTGVAATPSFAGLKLPTGAQLGSYARCDSNATGNVAWLPPVPVDIVNSSPYTVPNTSIASEIVASPVSDTGHITLPLLAGGVRRVLVVRNMSTTQTVIVHAQGTDHIWTKERTQIALPADSFTKLEAASDCGLWLPA